MSVTLADGGVRTADVLVGADGIRSRVRARIADEAPVYSGASGFRGLVPRSAVPELPDPDAVQFWMGPGAHVLHYAIGDVVNFLAVVDGPDPWPGLGGMIPAAPGELEEAFRDWHPAVRALLGAVPQSPRWGLFALPPLPRWSADRMVLLGDAAHAMVPHHGQGAGTSIEDAAHLGALLATSGPAEALAALPPTRIWTGRHDLFIIDSRSFLARLVAAGVDARLYEYEAAPHVFMAILPTREAKDALGLLAGMDAVLNTHCLPAHALMARLKGLGVRTFCGLHLVERTRWGNPNGTAHTALAYKHAAVAIDNAR